MGSPENIAIIGFTFLLAGFVKGVIGMGLPTVSLALLTASFGLVPAVALMIAPSFITNAWQATQGGAFGKIVRRFWLMLVLVVIGTWFGGSVLAAGDGRRLAVLLGVLLCVYSLLSFTRFRVPSPGKSEPWLSPVIGVVSGILTGLTGTFVIPGVLYLQSLGLQRDMLIQVMGVLFTVSTLALAVTLGHHQLISMELGAYSIGGVVPALAGMVIGQRLRKRLPEVAFTKIFFSTLLILGAYIAGRAVI